MAKERRGWSVAKGSAKDYIALVGEGFFADRAVGEPHSVVAVLVGAAAEILSGENNVLDGRRDGCEDEHGSEEGFGEMHLDGVNATGNQ